MSQILFAFAIATTLGIATHANAQFKVNEDDGIAASPRVRQMLNERKASKAAAAILKIAPTTDLYAGYRAVGSDGIAASPKVRQMLDEQRVSRIVTTPSQETVIAGYRPVGHHSFSECPPATQ